MEPGASCYADDLCITAQLFKQVEETTEEALDNLTTYYKVNSLHVNQKNTSHCVPSQEERGKQITKSGVENEREPENTAYPKYLGVTLDRSLCCQTSHTEHCKMKVATRNNLLTK